MNKYQKLESKLVKSVMNSEAYEVQSNKYRPSYRKIMISMRKYTKIILKYNDIDKFDFIKGEIYNFKNSTIKYNKEMIIK